ncbi:GntR family transcriptional regulator [Amycolatopsis sp. FDAARGOS 1241]|uniref:GntR family transcriptional regulator n=1 Tax=Amycolatopsis sp. FDAARGOS 1241 TaxID=2778070 RepID=UPI00195064FE|nr:GntR family transcriptional regulator [Amycolatopsis sp. FDAARGOS 1241]QRP50210.1 GntR family transcriptional regulator [Amycolatopsis sp. FDAARGOS 1241]
MSSANVFSSKGEVAYAELRGRILSGALRPGSRLEQNELAGDLGMSLTPLREAIRRLSSEGLIRLDAHRDARVAGMSAAEARQLFEVRLSLDPTAAMYAAQRRTADDLSALRAAVARLLPVTREWGEEALTVHRAFHRALYVASHNATLVRLLDDIWDKTDRYRRAGLELPPGNEPRTRDHQEHHRLVDLVAAGDDTGARELMQTHIERSLLASAIEALEQRERAGTATG